MLEKILNFYIWVSIAHLRCGYNDYNDYNNNLGSFYNGISVFMLDGDDVRDHCILCINMQNWSHYEGGGVSDRGNNFHLKKYSITRTLRYLKLIVVPLSYNSRIILLKNARMMIELKIFSLQEWHSTIELYRQHILYHIN